MTADEMKIVQRGVEARALLAIPAFHDVVAGLMNTHHDLIASTSDEDEKQREFHFRKMRAYQDVFAEVKARDDAGRQIEEFYASEAERADAGDNEE